jgi:hypothetical protein
MNIHFTRRSVIGRACLATLGAIGLGGAAQSANASVRRPGRLYRVTAIAGIGDDQQVSVLGGHGWLPLECVPPGWRPLIGDSVVVGPSPLLNRTSAEQLWLQLTHRAAPQELQPGRRIGGPNGPVITEATTLDPALSSLRSREDIRPRQVLVAVTLRSPSDGRERVLAIREA